MKAVVFRERRELAIADVAEPTVGRGEVKLRVRRAGICGTDAHIFDAEYIAPFPIVPGHECVCDVAEVGAGVAGLAEGQRVVVDPNLYCNACRFCRRGEHNHCVNWSAIGVTRAGVFAERVVAPAGACYAVPDDLADGAAALVEPLACVVHAMNRLPLAVGQSVLVLGCGAMGLLLVQALRHRGAGDLVAVDRVPERVALAAQLGANAGLAADAALDEQLSARQPDGFDVVVDATGATSAIEQGLAHLRARGRMLQFGVAVQDATIALRPFDLFKHDWQLIGSFALSYTFEQAIAWLGAGVFRTDPIIGEVVGFDGFAEAFERFRAGRTLKVHLDPQGAGG